MASVEAKQRESKLLIEYAAKAAEQFVSLYYSAYDSRNRVGLIPTLYLGTSTVLWNGNPIQGNGGVGELMDSLPATKHEVQSMDAHPVGGGSNEAGFAAPSILVTVSGVVTHHTPNSASALPPSNAPESSSTRTKGGRYDSSLPLDSLPRAFSQNFVLVNDPEGKGDGGVVVSWDSSNSVAANGGPGSGSGGGKKSGGGGGGSSADVLRAAAPTITGRFFVQADQLRFVG
ncbi:NTF2-like protein [Jaminaea rosea]|uniref:NTF2-like protein n=1 Tax=Jaminaea rosea TaxID=1569628 RepID=A0A316USF6_9BASI|nr:NTF2-like protein [Jaminaea rosea]PWN27924.1 NTF2-like protein [Jaminaea rosea]